MEIPQIVGILNVTPDSYFDGGKYNQVDAALAQAQQMIEEGADIIDIGGESTGPGSTDVSVEEELNRVIPILYEIRHTKYDIPISVDTYKADVARAAIEAGATMINDVTAGRGDPEMFSTLAKYDVPVVLMYSKDNSARTSKKDTEYEDVVATIKQFLLERIACTEAAGIDRSRIVIDPGMGHFISSKPEYSFEVIDRLQEFAEIAPVFVSPSRKSFLAGPKNLPTTERLPATIEASINCAKNGASYIRTHDTAAIKSALELYRRSAATPTK